MAVSFHSGTMRAAGGSDLAISVSPLGLVEMSDEDFEIHGPRMNRYALNWAFYLGHHWSYVAPPGESQLTFNWVKAFADYIINFNFSKGIHIGSPEASSGIIPHLMHRVWHVDNDMSKILFEMGQSGTVSGDIFVKVAFDPPYQDSLGMVHPPRIRFLPLNPAYCFPTYHPHDRTRLTEFKIKYKFYGRDAHGTRQVMTYVEVITDAVVREYINDEMISERANPLGEIPIAFGVNKMAMSSPWGLSDVQGLIPLNRTYNEKASDISSIIEYYAAPITVITGAKAQNLERGPRKVWAIPTKEASVTQLNLQDNLTSAMGFLELLKTAMHEETGVPHGALGIAQPISNTSGVSLNMTFMPMMQARAAKITNYTPILKRMNALAIKYAAVYEPDWLKFNPQITGMMPRPDQYVVMDPEDPLTYETTIRWQSPLPLDKLLALNEQQALMAAGLESKVGAMRALGEEFPEQKVQEVFEEMMEDAKRQAAMQLLTAQSSQFIMASTGMTPDGQPLIVPGVTGTDAEGNPQGMMPSVDPMLAQEIATMAFVPNPPMRFDLNGPVGE